MAVLSLTTASATVLKDHYEKIKGMTGVEMPISTSDWGIVSMEGTIVPLDSVKTTVQSFPEEYLKGITKSVKPKYIFIAQEDKKVSEGVMLMPMQLEGYDDYYAVLFFVIPNDEVKDFIKKNTKE